MEVSIIRKKISSKVHRHYDSFRMFIYRIFSKSYLNRSFIYSSTFPRDKKGKIIEAAEFQKRATSGEVARVAPNRKWFGRYLDLICCHLESLFNCLPSKLIVLKILDSSLLTFVRFQKVAKIHRGIMGTKCFFIWSRGLLMTILGSTGIKWVA